MEGMVKDSNCLSPSEKVFRGMAFVIGLHRILGVDPHEGRSFPEKERKPQRPFCQVKKQ